MALPFISESPSEGLNAIYLSAAEGEGNVNVALYKGKTIASLVDYPDDATITVDGDVESGDLGLLTITGDGSISFTIDGGDVPPGPIG